MIKLTHVLAVTALAVVPPLQAQSTPPNNPQIDYPGFATLTLEVAQLREERLLDAEAFFAAARSDGALLLDTRSAEAFAEGHIDGAVNLPFSDFTEEALLEVIGENRDRPIYIYCNNNFSDDIAPVMTKRAPLALNIPTFINLVGYGYTNVWELDAVLPMSEVDWVSSRG